MIQIFIQSAGDLFPKILRLDSGYINVGYSLCWSQLRDVDNRYKILVPDSLHQSHQHDEKSHRHSAVANIKVLLDS